MYVCTTVQALYSRVDRTSFQSRVALTATSGPSLGRHTRCKSINDPSSMGHYQILEIDPNPAFLRHNDGAPAFWRLAAGIWPLHGSCHSTAQYSTAQHIQYSVEVLSARPSLCQRIKMRGTDSVMGFPVRRLSRTSVTSKAHVRPDLGSEGGKGLVRDVARARAGAEAVGAKRKDDRPVDSTALHPSPMPPAP